MKSIFSGWARYCIVLCLAQIGFGQAPAASRVNPPSDPFAPIVLLSRMDQDLNGSFSFHLLKMGFAVGDGTVIVTAEHCIDSFRNPPAPSSSRRLFAVSPYYGDLFPVKILAYDDQADAAILKADWPGHPAFALAEPNALQPGDTTLIPSRPQFANAQHEINTQSFLDRLTIERINLKNSSDDILFTSAGLVKPGWSGSPIVLEDSQKVAGIVCLLKYSTRTRALFFKQKVAHAAGCHIQSIRDLIQANHLSESALAVPRAYPAAIADSNSVFGHIQDTFNAVIAKDWPASLAHIQEAAKARPHSAYLHVWLAILASAQDNETDEEKQASRALTESAMRTAMALAPEDPHILAIAGSTFTRFGKRSQAKTYAQGALAADPNNALALYTQLFLLHGEDPNLAATFGRRLTAAEPNNTMAWFYTSTALLNDYRPEEALCAAQQAVIADPNGLVRAALAKALVVLDRLEEARDAYEFMTQKCECENCWYQYALFMIHYYPDQALQAQEALDAARASQKKKGITPRQLDQLQVRIFSKTDPNQGETMLRSCLDNDANNADAWWRLADILRTKKQYDSAVQAAQKAVDMDPNNVYRARLADCLTKAGHPESAQALFDTMLKRHPERPRYWLFYAQNLLDRGKPELALEALNHVDTSPKLPWRVSESERDKLLFKIDPSSVEIQTVR
ncbi:MAG: tetratricopeptide repeat protein [Phycisphaerae bacterium]|nr:tetratricopeptide repeat protein [Phycisphaerae bacterium]